MRRVRRAGRVVDEEGLVGSERFLLADPLHRLLGHVGGEVVALFGCGLLLDRRRAFEDGRIVLVGFSADESVEVLETASAARPVLERTDRTRLPHRNLVTLAELRGRVAVELEHLGEWRAGIRTDRVLSRRRRRQLGDGPHADRVMVASGQQRGPRRRAEGRRMKAIVLESLGRELLERRRLARAAKRARRAESHVVDEYDENVRCASGRTQRYDRRVFRVGVFRVVRREPGRGDVGNGQHVARARVVDARHWSRSTSLVCQGPDRRQRIMGQHRRGDDWTEVQCKGREVEARHRRTAQWPNGAMANERDGLKARNVREAPTAKRERRDRGLENDGASDQLARAVSPSRVVSAVRTSVVRQPRRPAFAPLGRRASRSLRSRPFALSRGPSSYRPRSSR